MRKKIKSLEEENRILRSQKFEQGKLEEQLRQAQKMEPLALLAGGIAHDFNNILQAILGYTQIALLSKTNDNPDYQTFVQIENIIEKGRELTGQVLTFGREIKSKSNPLNLNPTIEDVAKLFGRTMPKMIDTKMRLAEDLKRINANACQIEQLLMNLSTNSIDAMSDSGELSFTTNNITLGCNPPHACIGAPPGEYVLLTVADTGCGMDSKTIDRIFEPFFTTKKEGKGTGLGLSMVYAIVRKHDGFIDCSSEVGKETIFKIYFPVSNNNLKQPKTSHRREKAVINGSGEKILMVDDNEDILKMCEEMLLRCGYRVTTANNGEEALYEYRQSPADLVILDIGMPKMGGMKCLQELLQSDQNVKVLIISGYSSEDLIDEALELGAKAFLPKPIPLNKLLKAIRVVLDGD